MQLYSLLCGCLLIEVLPSLRQPYDGSPRDQTRVCGNNNPVPKTGCAMLQRDIQAEGSTLLHADGDRFNITRAGTKGVHDDNFAFHLAIYHRLQSRLEREIWLQEGPPAAKSKVVLVIINLLGLGFFGIDRCYLGQVVMGTLKCVTLGGAGILFLCDYFVIMVNSLAKWSTLTTFGFNAKFEPYDVEAAFWISLACVIIFCFPFPFLQILFGKAPHKETIVGTPTAANSPRFPTLHEEAFAAEPESEPPSDATSSAPPRTKPTVDPLIGANRFSQGDTASGFGNAGAY